MINKSKQNAKELAKLDKAKKVRNAYLPTAHLLKSLRPIVRCFVLSGLFCRLPGLQMSQEGGRRGCLSQKGYGQYRVELLEKLRKEKRQGQLDVSTPY